jgi:hypothetical protein
MVLADCAQAGLRIDAADPIEELISDEGEYAAIATVVGRHAGGQVKRTLGYVFGDDFHSTIDGWAVDPALVRRLVLGDSHMLGVRRRCFRHATPRGWRAVRAGLFHTHLLAPSGDAQIIVYPALPSAAEPVAGMLLGLALADGDLLLERTITCGGLSGSRYDIVAACGPRVLVVLEDDRYAYGVRLDGGAACNAAFEQVLASVRPIPRVRSRAAPAAVELMSAWAA